MKILFLLVIISSFLLSDNNETIKLKLTICEHDYKILLWFVGALLSTLIYLIKTYLSLIKENSDNKALAELSKEITDTRLAIDKIEKGSR